MSEVEPLASAAAHVGLSDSSPECAPEASLSPWLAAVQLVEQILLDNSQIWLLAAVCFLIGFVSACQPSRQTPRQSGSCRDDVAGELLLLQAALKEAVQRVAQKSQQLFG